MTYVQTPHQHARMLTMTQPTTLLADLQGVRDSIWIHGPEHFNMEMWFRTRDLDGTTHDFGLYTGEALVDITACGTTGCIAGHAALVTGLSLSSEICGRFDVSYDLFDVDTWHLVELSDGRTLRDVCWDLNDDTPFDGDHSAIVCTNEAQWRAAIHYFDDRIKTLEAQAS